MVNPTHRLNSSLQTGVEYPGDIKVLEFGFKISVGTLSSYYCAYHYRCGMLVSLGFPQVPSVASNKLF